MRFHRLQRMILFMLVSLFGCQQGYGIQPTTYSETVSKSTFTFVSPPNSTLTSTPTITVTPSPQPTTTITLTPLPTIAKNKVQAEFDQLYRYNHGCSLPCWWGITPGVTTWGETLHFIDQFGDVSNIVNQKFSLTEKPSNYTLARWEFPSPIYESNTSVDIEVQNGIVVAIRMWGDIGERMFPLEKLYTEYGQPNRIFIVMGACIANDCDAVLYLLYDENNFLFVYPVHGAIKDKTVTLCITRNSDITTWAHGVNIDLDAQKDPNSKFIPLQMQIISKDLQSNKIEGCFDAPIELWIK